MLSDINLTEAQIEEFKKSKSYEPIKNKNIDFTIETLAQANWPD